MKKKDDSDLMLLKMVAAKEPDITKAWQKALANFMFREIIEDAHVKYGISQEDMKEMNKKAANRAKAFLDVINPRSENVPSVCFLCCFCHGVGCSGDN